MRRYATKIVLTGAALAVLALAVVSHLAAALATVVLVVSMLGLIWSSTGETVVQDIVGDVGVPASVIDEAVAEAAKLTKDAPSPASDNSPIGATGTAATQISPIGVGKILGA
jgi:4-amino-4-deoxy-L-arabinose transferase-like glycosyltransferase